MPRKLIKLRFDDLPGKEAAKFIEAEDETGKSIKLDWEISKDFMTGERKVYLVVRPEDFA